MAESAIENYVVKRAEAEGFFVRKVRWLGRVGAPDRLFARADRGQVWIEFKDEGEEPRGSQVREHGRMREAGFELHVCDNVEDALRILGIR